MGLAQGPKGKAMDIIEIQCLQGRTQELRGYLASALDAELNLGCRQGTGPALKGLAVCWW